MWSETFIKLLNEVESEIDEIVRFHTYSTIEFVIQHRIEEIKKGNVKLNKKE